MVSLEDIAASRCGGEYAVGDPAISHSREEVIDDFVPRPRRRQRVSLVIRDDFHITLAERHEQQDSMRLIGICDCMRVEFTMRELPGVSVLDALRYNPKPDRKPVD